MRLSFSFAALVAVVAMGAGRPAERAPAVPKQVTAPAHDVRAPIVWAHTSDVRSLATQGRFVWAATSGGLVRYDATTRERTVFGVTSGLDSIDVRSVELVSGELVVRTAEGTCKLVEDRFACVAGVAPAAAPPTDLHFRGDEVTSRAAVSDGTFVGTRASGAWFLPQGEPALATRLDPAENEAPRSFVKKVVSYRGHVWLGTFADGLRRSRATSDAVEATPELAFETEDVHAPFRMVNDLLVSGGTLLVAANEGLFATHDGRDWSRVELAGAHGVTGLAQSKGAVWATSTAALWKLDVGRDVKASWSWWRPAGTKSLQAIAESGGALYLASEDRGVIRFDGGKFTAMDRLSGLPTSWAVDVAGDAHGGAYMATLRDGVVHVHADGTWSMLPQMPGNWISSVSARGNELCVGTQSGAACYEDTSKPPSVIFDALPDPRAHAVVRIGGAWLVGTEAGTALYRAPLTSAPATHVGS